MDFDDTAQEAAFRAEARAWLEANRPRGWREALRSKATQLELGRRWQAKKADARWAFIGWPREYGGRGASPMQQAIWAQEEGELARLTGFLALANTAAPTLMAYASGAQKRELLPRMARADDIWCQLFSEPGAGSDLAGIRTRAERRGDEWVVNGQKIWTSYAHIAHWAILVTRSDPSVPKHQGLTFFFIDMHAPGIEVRPIVQISGDSDFNEVFLTDVRVPDEQRLGEVGEGWKVALTTLMAERASIGQSFTTQFDAMWAELEGLAIEGRPALDHPVVRDRLADFYVTGAGMRNTTFRALSALSKGRPPGPEASIGKLVMGAQRQAEASFMLDMQNCAGILVEPDGAGAEAYFQKAFFRCAANRIEGGTDEVLRNIIAERVLGLPGDLRVDKDVPFNEIPGSNL